MNTLRLLGFFVAVGLGHLSAQSASDSVSPDHGPPPEIAAKIAAHQKTIQDAVVALKKGDRAAAEGSFSKNASSGRELAGNLVAAFAHLGNHVSPTERQLARDTVLASFTDAAAKGSKSDRIETLLAASDFAARLLHDPTESARWVAHAAKIDAKDDRVLAALARLEVARQRNLDRAKGSDEARRYAEFVKSTTEALPTPSPVPPSPVGSGTPLPPPFHRATSN